MPDQALIDAVPAIDAIPARRCGFAVSIVGVYLVSRLILLGVVVDMFGPSRAIIRLAGIWDGTHYLHVAAHGYPAVVTHHPSSVIAFFPLYPMIVRLVASAMGVNLAVAATVVSFLAGATACVAVGQLARDRAGDAAGVRAGCLLALAPGAAFLSAAYAEGVAISFAALALIMVDRRRWWAAGIIGALATATSPLALPIVAAAAWAAWRAGPRRAYVAPIVAASGFGSYCLYLWAHVGTPFAWFDAERAGWGGHRFDLLAPVKAFTTWSGATLVETLCTVAAVVALWAMHRARVPTTWWVFTVPLLASVVFDGALWLTPRLLLSAFAFGGASAIVLDERRFRIVATCSGIVMVVVLVSYVSFPGFVFKP